MPCRKLVFLMLQAAAVLAPQVAASQPHATGAAIGPRAATAAAPRTPWGDPDLQGVWTSATRTPLERPIEFGSREFLNDEEIVRINTDLARRARDDKQDRPAREGQTGGGPEHWYEGYRLTSRRTSLIIDPPNGRLPPLTPEAATRHEAERARFEAPATVSDLGVWVRCIGRGIPGSMLPTGYNNNYQILQAPGVVAIVYEMIHDVRVIPLDGRPQPPPSNMRQWLGHALGRWDGTTLVVETTNFRSDHVPISSINGIGSTSAGLRVVERFTRTAADTIEYRATVDDPGTYTSRWTATLPLTRGAATDRLFEYACHEGNYAVPNILSAARAAERAGVAHR